MNILIVESAAKGRTLQKILGKGWKVVATGGHIQTLPHDRKKHGKDGSKAMWASRKGALPDPPWVWTDRGEKAFQKILEAGGEDATWWIATDPDREGEFIAWCLDRLLEGKGERHRVTFQEITETAVKRAIANPREVDRDMVDSALVRKFVDRLVGYRTSKLARSVVGGRSSMGRVQTPTLGFVVERELEREAHVPIPYFEVRASAVGVDLSVRFHDRGDPDAWRDDAGKAVYTRTFDGQAAQAVHDALDTARRVTLTDVREGTRSRKTRPPYTTDALLQEAGSRLGWSPKKTSALAAMLYEAGHITYIRTDSTRLAAEAVAAARQVITDTWDAEHLAPAPTPAKAGAAAAAKDAAPVQDAHEAIRPTHLEVVHVDDDMDDEDARTLYRLVRARTLASLMTPSRHAQVRLTASVEGSERPLSGTVSWRLFAGWEAAFAVFLDAPTLEPPAVELSTGAVWPLDAPTEDAPNPRLIEDATRPPPRYRAHTLVKAMKDAGIGRPSTYARTVEKLEERGYIVPEDGALAPTQRGRAVWLDAAPLYGDDDRDVELFSTDYTAHMEEGLDAIAHAESPAPDTWVRWRDEIRDLHEKARSARDSGSITPRRRDQLQRLLDNAPDDAERPDDPAALTEAEAREWVKRLQQAGVSPAPTSKQRGFIERLVEELAMPPAEAAALVDLDDLDAVQTSKQASALIEALLERHAERQPPSTKQLRYLHSLREKLGLSEAEAAALIGASDLEGLTGGREGTASALIDALNARIKQTDPT